MILQRKTNLEQALLILLLYCGVPGDATANPALGSTGLFVDNYGTDGHIEVCLSLRCDVPHRPGINLSWRPFDACQDTHRFDLGSSRDRGAREQSRDDL